MTLCPRSLPLLSNYTRRAALSRALHCPPEPLSALHPLSGLIIKPFSGDIEKENTCFNVTIMSVVMGKENKTDQ